ncbi:F-box protein SKIP23-like [Setaria italica]|uniref:F-box domain-containing protein n=1 Tax=Setaria italica TaxID=4555 RepID=K3XSZ4_SETIT|nr:F-box protein SKIP23-like [Setaria italica]
MEQAVAGRDWSQLPADLVVLVLGALEVPELLRSAAVCRSWRAAYKLDPRLDATPLFRGPCLLYSSADRDADVATLRSLSESAAADHTTSTRRRHHVTLPAPSFRGRYVVGSSHGWLITADEQSELFLVNPVTRAQIALPPVKTMRSLNLRLARSSKALQGYFLHYMDVAAGCRNSHMYDLREFYDPNEARFLLYRRVALSADPSSGNCIVLIIHCFQEQLSFARIGDAEWTWIHGEEHFCHYQDLFYNDKDSLFYALRGTGEVHTIDFSGSSSPVVKIIFKKVVNYIDNYKYLVRAPRGDLIQVWRDDDVVDNGEWVTKKLVVYKMDLVHQKVAEVKDLQGYALFLGFNTSFFLPVACSPMLKANCIYHTDDNTEYIGGHKFSRRHIVAFSLDENVFAEFLPCDSRLNWPPPIWIRPSCEWVG